MRPGSLTITDAGYGFPSADGPGSPMNLGVGSLITMDAGTGAPSMAGTGSPDPFGDPAGSAGFGEQITSAGLL